MKVYVLIESRYMEPGFYIVGVYTTPDLAQKVWKELENNNENLDTTSWATYEREMVTE